MRLYDSIIHQTQQILQNAECVSLPSEVGRVW